MGSEMCIRDSLNTIRHCDFPGIELPLPSVKGASRQPAIAIVGATYGCCPFRIVSYLNRLRIGPSCHPKSGPNLGRVFLIDFNRTVSRGASLAAPLPASAIKGRTRVHDDAMTEQAQLKAEGVSMSMTGLIPRTNFGKIKDSLGTLLHLDHEITRFFQASTVWQEADFRLLGNTEFARVLSKRMERLSLIHI